jgi:hypothetical protein
MAGAVELGSTGRAGITAVRVSMATDSPRDQRHQMWP